jgi:hypothetical protein
MAISDYINELFPVRIFKSVMLPAKFFLAVEDSKANLILFGNVFIVEVVLEIVY